jgi:hypothetical protein
MLPRPVAAVCAVALLAAIVAGCGLASGTPPAPTPADFLGISAALVRRGITIDHVVSGDAGCDDPVLSKTAISFRASGLDQAAPATIHLYIFGSRDSFEKLHAEVDRCARTYATDPDAFASVDASPFVAAGAGPWAPAFNTAIRAGLTEAAGTGG